MEQINKAGLTEKEFLKTYNADKYKKPSVTVDMALFTVTSEEEKNRRRLPEKELQILMIKRGDHPCIGQWALPGGFVNVNEAINDAAKRELKEETNVENIYMEQLYTWGDVQRDPRTRVISVSYLALVDSSKLNVRAGDDAAEAKWFSVRAKEIKEVKIPTESGLVIEKHMNLELEDGEDKCSAVIKEVKKLDGTVISCEYEVVENNGIAFDHAKIILYSLERLRNKVEYTNIAFNLMAEYFSLSELQQVYEIILDKELLPAAFRRKNSRYGN
jgi:ADP-ribose pyrophosphatase YjhB (NUDIX family)